MKLGQHMTDEQRAKESASKLGHTTSIETRAKISSTRMGIRPSPETRARVSEILMGHVVTPETRTKTSAWQQGRKLSPETCAKIAIAHWRGGQKMADARTRAKRRTLGFNPLNSPLSGCEGHHVNRLDVIYMPTKLHQSIHHNQHTGRGMAQMNAIAYNFLFKQEVEAAIAAKETTNVSG